MLLKTRGNGTVVFESLSGEKRDKVLKGLQEQFMTMAEDRDGKTFVNVNFDPERFYNCYNVYCSLSRATNEAVATHGSVNFVDDDFHAWRFFLKDGIWTEQIGSIGFGSAK